MDGNLLVSKNFIHQSMCSLSVKHFLISVEFDDNQTNLLFGIRYWRRSVALILLPIKSTFFPA